MANLRSLPLCLQLDPRVCIPKCENPENDGMGPLPGLNLLYYDESVLLGIASVTGKPIRVDQNTLRVEGGRFARLCVEIDLSLPVVDKFWLRDHWYHVEYEGLHLCSNYGCYGHLGQNCQGIQHTQDSNDA